MRFEVEWLPIETAPKDGRAVLVSSTFRAGESSFGVCKPQRDGYQAGGGKPVWRTTDQTFLFPGQVTHWMPIPERVVIED